MRHALSFGLFGFLMLMHTSAFAQPESESVMVVAEGRMVVAEAPSAAESDDDARMVVVEGKMVVTDAVVTDPSDDVDPDAWRALPLHSLSLSYGAMAYAYGGYGPALEFTYYHQTGPNSRQGVSLRWFHDNEHDFHYVADKDDLYRCAQIEMVSLDYQIQGFKRYGNFEFSLAGGFGIGVTAATYHGKRSDAEIKYKRHSASDEEGDNVGALLYGISGEDWDFFVDVSITGGLEYYLGENFSIGANASIHYHTLFYIDISASLQAKVLF